MRAQAIFGFVIKTVLNFLKIIFPDQELKLNFGDRFNQGHLYKIKI